MKYLFTAALYLFLIGCSSNRLPGEHYEAPHARKSDDAPIDVYSTKLPTRPYREIGAYTANPKKLLIWARRMGADGVIFTNGAEVRTSSAQVGNVIVSKSRRHGQQGVAIVYTDQNTDMQENPTIQVPH